MFTNININDYFLFAQDRFYEDTKHIYDALTINIETKHALVNALFMFTICGSL